MDSRIWKTFKFDLKGPPLSEDESELLRQYNVAFSQHEEIDDLLYEIRNKKMILLSKFLLIFAIFISFVCLLLFGEMRFSSFYSSQFQDLIGFLSKISAPAIILTGYIVFQIFKALLAMSRQIRRLRRAMFRLTELLAETEELFQHRAYPG